MRPQLSPVTGATPAGGNQQPPSSTDDRTPSCDAQSTHMQPNKNLTVQTNQTLPHMHAHAHLDTQQIRSETPHQPATQPLTPTPTDSTVRTRFLVCPPGEICPSTGCTFPHYNNSGRLTRHWRAMHGAKGMPGGPIDSEYYNRQSARIRYNQCPHEGCTFQHQRSSTRLNAHLARDHRDLHLLRNTTSPITWCRATFATRL